MELILSVLAGALLGTLTGLGVGGGSLLLLWLTLAVRMDPADARAISLLFFFPSAAVSCLFHRDSIPWKAVLPAMLTGCISAAAFTFLSQNIDRTLLRRILGGLFLLVGSRELLTRPRK